MDKVKILHCADLHFDTPFKEFKGILAQRSKEEIKEVFSTIIDLCLSNKIEILLVAGDVFDNLTVNKATLKFIGDEFARIKNTMVFISPGNHDPYNSKSFYNLIDWPENVKIFKEEIEGIEIPHLKTKVWGAGFNDKYVHEALIKNITPKKEYINLMVIHGEVTGNKSSYNPISIKSIEESGMDYIAIGHTHEFSGVLKASETYYAYSGCPQGRGFDELGEKGVVIGEVAKGWNDLRFKSICKRKYIDKKIDISNTFGYEEIVRIILKEIDEEDRKNNFFKITLVGEVKENFNLNEDVLSDKLSSYFYFCKLRDKSRVIVNLEELENDLSIKGMYAKKLLNEIKETEDEEEKEVLMMALKLGLQSLSREEVNLNDY
ncbi:MAG: metallophosphoesterase family protein [Clostridium sp.]